MSDLLVVCGLNREAALMAGPGFETVCSGGDVAALTRRLEGLSDRTFSAILSFGLAGALDPILSVGDVILPDAVLSDAGRHPSTPALADGIAGTLAARGIRIASREPIAGSDAPLASAQRKAALRAASGAGAVDMESHVTAAFAARRDLPFAVLRVVSDTANRAVPAAAVAAMRPDGGIDIPAVLASLLRDPGQLRSLIGLARDGSRAFGILRRLGEAFRGASFVSSPP